MASSITAWCVLHILAILYASQASGTYNKICPHSCVCSNENVSTVDCLLISMKGWTQACGELNKFYSDIDLKLVLKFQRLQAQTFFPPLNCLPPLNSLHITQASLNEIDVNLFQAVTITSELDLSMSNISQLSDKSFNALETVHTFNLSHNMISSLTNKTFRGLLNLKTLDLSYNRLVTIKISCFTELTTLEYLNLAHNKLTVFTSWHLPPSLDLKVLILQGNNLKWIDVDRNNFSESPLKSLSTLDISLNPLDCSCMLDYLLRSLHQIQTLENPERSICMSPRHLETRPILSLNKNDMICTSPRNVISYPSHEKDVRFKESVTLECQSDGNPSPSIIWITPWGKMFTHSPISLPTHSEFPVDDMQTFKQYEEGIVDVVTTIFVNEKNEMIISHFRGSMVGNFTCVAFNIAGNKSEQIHLSIASVLKSVYMSSLFIGGYCASGFLIFGFVVGFIKMAIIKLSHKICFIVPIFSKAPSVKPVVEIISNNTDSERGDDNNLSDLSLYSIECIDSDNVSKEFDQNLSDSPYEKRPLQIIESLEEARERLRFGVGRKVESMKRNVQSIKDSSSAYVHTIMESGSTAASRMKASMAIGVETVKSHVQSFKELCGTGDMGGNTISMVSVETDIDTNQQRSIVRQITYV